MHLWILSDLHIGSCRPELPDPGPGYDVLIAAGDIFTPASSGVDWLSRRARGKPVIYVPGNHEWYSPNHLNNVEAETERAETRDGSLRPLGKAESEQRGFVFHKSGMALKVGKFRARLMGTVDGKMTPEQLETLAPKFASERNIHIVDVSRQERRRGWP
jgi:3',5'-cyclic AMP phosphodiesterase CpdA